MEAETVADRLRVALDLAETGLALMFQNLRRSHPDASQEELGRLFEDWLGRRPAARDGDRPGPVRRLFMGVWRP